MTGPTRPRVALLGLILESNRFAKPAGYDDFLSNYWLEGDAILEDARRETPKIAPEMVSFIHAMDATGPWEPVPILLAASRPTGPIEQEVYEDAAARIAQRLADAGAVDAVYFAHHGAMVATHIDDPDGDLASQVRAAVGKAIPAVMTLDLHANISDAMVAATDVIIGYRTNPHVDMIERGEEAAFTLRRILSGDAKPKAAHVKPPLAPASVSLLTAAGPYADLIDYGQRRQAEMSGAILNVSIFGNFIFADVPENGISVVVTARDDQAQADALANEIAAKAWADRERFVRELTSFEKSVEMATAPGAKPVIFADSGDNPGGGGTGRTTEFLAALHAAGAKNLLYGSFFDKALAKEASDLGVGQRFEARFNRDVGNGSYEQWDKPFVAEAEVLAVHDGEVVGRLGLLQGRKLSLGPSVALKIGGMTVIVISARSQTADPMFFEMFGLDIAAADTVVVKSRGHFRAGFLPFFPPEQVHEADTAGLTSPVLERWPFERVPRPSFPLDRDAKWSP